MLLWARSRAVGPARGMESGRGNPASSPSSVVQGDRHPPQRPGPTESCRPALKSRIGLRRGSLSDAGGPRGRTSCSTTGGLGSAYEASARLAHWPCRGYTYARLRDQRSLDRAALGTGSPPISTPPVPGLAYAPPRPCTSPSGPCNRRAARSARVRGRLHSRSCDRRRSRPVRRRGLGAVGSQSWRYGRPRGPVDAPSPSSTARSTTSRSAPRSSLCAISDDAGLRLEVVAFRLVLAAERHRG